MSSMADVQRHTFQKRIKRIQKGGPNTSGHILVGSQDDSMGKTVKPKRVRRGPGFLQRLGQALTDLVVMPISFALGGLGMVTGIVAVFHLRDVGLMPTEVEGLQAELLPYADVLIAVIVAVLVGSLLRLSRGPRRIALFAGIAAVYFVQDSLFQTYPDVFARLMSNEAPFRAAVEALAG